MKDKELKEILCLECWKNLVSQRAKLAHARAKSKGVAVGRKKSINSDQIRELLEKKIPVDLVAKIAKCSIRSVRAEQSLIKANFRSHLQKSQ